MFKGKKNQSTTPSTTAKGQRRGFWQRLKSIFSTSKDKADLSTLDKHDALSHVSIEDLELEVLETPNRDKNSNVEIAFINPETGELEVLHLPQETFKVKVQEDTKADSDDTLVILELNAPYANEVRKDEEDEYSKITHFPPSNRLH